MRSPRRVDTPALALALVTSTVLVTVALHGCAVGSEPDVTVDDEDAGGGSRLDAGGRPEPYRPDAAPPDAGRDGEADVGTPDAGDACAEALAKVTYAFDTDEQGWTHGRSDGITDSDPSWPYDPWTWGTTTAGTSCKAGSCFGAERTQNYAQCQRGYLLSPALDLSACQGRNVALVFHHAYAFWTGSYGGKTWYDGGVVEVSADGQSWQVPAASGVYSGAVAINPDMGLDACVRKPFGVDGKQGFTGAKTTTTRVELPLPAAAIGATTRLRFSMASGVSTQTSNWDTSRAATAMGWRIDEVGFVLR